MKGLQVGLLFTVIYFIFIVNSLSAHANEADYVWTNSKDGTVKIKDYIGTDTSIIIPNELGGKVVTEIGMAAFGEKKSYAGCYTRQRHTDWGSCICRESINVCGTIQ